MPYVMLLIILLVAVISIILVCTFLDYGRHRRPLVEADPNIRYTLGHHVRVVTIPLLRYRLHIRFEKKPTNIIGH